MDNTFSLESVDEALESLHKSGDVDGATKADIVTARGVLAKVAAFCHDNNLSNKSTASIENLGEQVVFNNDVAMGTDISVESLKGLVSDCNVPAEWQDATVRELARILGNGTSADRAFKGPTDQKGLISFEEFAGGSAANFLQADTKASVEAFGLDIDRLQQDNRISMAVAIMRPFRSIIDQLLPRISGSSDVVTIKVAAPQMYNVGVINGDPSKGGTGDVRNNPSAQIPLVEAFKSPSLCSTQPKRMVPQTAMDTGSTNLIYNDALVPGAIVIDQSVNFADLCFVSGAYGYGAINNTDLVAPGGRIEGIVVEVTGTPSGGTAAVTEKYYLNTRWQQYANFVQNANELDSGDQIASMPFQWGLSSASVPLGAAAGTTSQLLTFNDAKVQIQGKVNGSVNLKTAQLEGMATLKVSLVPAAGTDASAISGATKTAYAGLSIKVAAWVPELYYDEENLRKTTAAVRCNYSQKQFQVPMGKNFFAEYQLSQASDENVVNSVTTMVALGNTSRGLTIVINRLNDVAAALAWEQANPEVVGMTPVRAQSLAGSLCLPVVLTDIIDYSDAQTLTMRESERLTELHGRARTRMTALTSNVHANSMYTYNLTGGEKPRYNVLVYRTESDLIFGIPDYHSALQDGSEKYTGQDAYDLTLPNGVVLHIVKTDIIDYKGQVLAIPYREGDPTHITNFGRIQDCGTYSATYTNVELGAAWRRALVNSREIVFPTNLMGIILTITGLAKQTGGQV